MCEIMIKNVKTIVTQAFKIVETLYKLFDKLKNYIYRSKVKLFV